MTARTGMHSGTPFAQANGSSFARASFDALLSVVDTVLAVSIFAILGILLSRSLLPVAAAAALLLLVGIIILRVLRILQRPVLRPDLSAA